jgi:hypothetical protein
MLPELLIEVQNEMNRARETHRPFPVDVLRGVGIIHDESGEAFHAAMEWSRHDAGSAQERIQFLATYGEVMHVAAAAMEWLHRHRPRTQQMLREMSEGSVPVMGTQQALAVPSVFTSAVPSVAPSLVPAVTPIKGDRTR